MPGPFQQQHKMSLFNSNIDIVLMPNMKVRAQTMVFFKLSVLLALILTAVESSAQRLSFFNGPYTVMDSIKGRAVYAYYDLGDDSIQYQGDYRFTSDIILKDGAFDVAVVNVNGNFRRGVKRGVWEYEQSRFTVRLNSIVNLTLDGTLDGFQTIIKGPYREGLPHGTWETKTVKIEDSKQVGSTVNSSLNFNNGIADGRFVYENKDSERDIFIKGRFSENGFMDGLWELKYLRDSIQIYEERNYVNGMLTDLFKVSLEDPSNPDTIHSIAYFDVKDRLVGLLSQSDDLNFKKGDKGFGVLFDNGYRRSDIRLVAQEEGNKFLEDVFMVFDDKKSVIGAVADIVSPVIKFTGRFEYVYYEEEDSILSLIEPLLNELDEKVDTLINNATFDINRRNDELLARGYAFLQLIEKKKNSIIGVVERIQRGDFKYSYRDNYYPDGVPNLDKADSIEYTVNGKTKYVVFTSDHYIDSPDSLVFKIYDLTKDIKRQVKEKLESVELVLIELQKEEKISNMDAKIVKTSQTLSNLYTKQQLREDTAIVDVTDFKSLFLTDKEEITKLQKDVYKRFSDELRESFIDEYSSEEDFEKKLQLGEKLVDLMKSIIDVHPILAEIDRMPKQLDSTFTIYSENPFFDRMMESKILTNIYSRGVERLLPVMVDELMRYRTGNDLRKKVDEIIALRDRLIELAESPDDDGDVRRLDRRLRRENVPDRIKRLLGL